MATSLALPFIQFNAIHCTFFTKLSKTVGDPWKDEEKYAYCLELEMAGSVVDLLFVARVALLLLGPPDLVT